MDDADPLFRLSRRLDSFAVELRELKALIVDLTNAVLKNNAALAELPALKARVSRTEIALSFPPEDGQGD